MNRHKNPRLTFARRLEIVLEVIEGRASVSRAARSHGVSDKTARKWLGRYLAGGEAGLVEASSRSAPSPRSIDPAQALAVVELRRKGLSQARIALALGVSKSTVERVLRRAGRSLLGQPEAAAPAVRDEHEAPGDTLHIDIKKLGRIERAGRRVPRTDRSRGAEFLFVAVDDHARIGFTAMHPDQTQASAVAFLHAAVAYYARLGVTIRRLLTDNGSAFRSTAFVQACRELGIARRFSRPHRPQSNGKAERFIQSALRITAPTDDLSTLQS